MVSNNTEIENIVIEIVNSLRDGKKKKVTHEDIDKNLFGTELMSEAYEIAGVYCEIEKEFNIKIKESVFEQYGFNTVSDICAIVETSKKSNP